MLALLPEVCSDGGIQRFNRTLLAACEELGVVCDALSLNDAGALPGGASEGSERPRPQRLTGFDGSRVRFSLAAAARLAGGRYDWLVVGHIHFLALALAARALCVHRRPQVVLVAHGIEVWSMIGWVRRRALARVAKILCVSTYTRRRILEQAPGLDTGRLKIFPNAIAEHWSRVTPAAGNRTLPNRFVLSVTRLEKGDRDKGIVTVLEALPMVQDDALQYLVVGRGGDIEFLKLAARRFGVADRVQFWGAVTDAELADLYPRCLAFVLPSGKEGFGIVFLEAMYFGAPVIAAAAKGALDVIEDGRTGLLVPFGDAIGVARAIDRLAADAPLRASVRANGRACVVDGGKFTFARFVERCRGVFDFT